jgi:hypothetical protein
MSTGRAELFSRRPAFPWLLSVSLVMATLAYGEPSLSRREAVESDHSKPVYAREGHGSEREDEEDEAEEELEAREDGQEDEVGEGEGEGNEVTGLLGAFLFGLSNATVVLSLGVRGLARVQLLNTAFIARLRRFDALQRRWLRPLHYPGNLLALAIASAHFVFSACASTLLPELGFAVAVGICLTGVVLKFGAPVPSVRRLAFRLHTTPVALALLVVLLVGGHGVID